MPAVSTVGFLSCFILDNRLSQEYERQGGAGPTGGTTLVPVGPLQKLTSSPQRRNQPFACYGSNESNRPKSAVGRPVRRSRNRTFRTVGCQWHLRHAGHSAGGTNYL